jgi:hypothetical protein
MPPPEVIKAQNLTHAKCVDIICLIGTLERFSSMRPYQSAPRWSLLAYPIELITKIPKFLCKELSSAPAAKCVVGFSFYIVSDRLSREKKYKGILTTSGHIRRLLRTKSCSFSDPGSKTWCSDVNHLKFRI